MAGADVPALKPVRQGNQKRVDFDSALQAPVELFQSLCEAKRSVSSSPCQMLVRFLRPLAPLAIPAFGNCVIALFMKGCADAILWISTCRALRARRGLEPVQDWGAVTSSLRFC